MQITRTALASLWLVAAIALGQPPRLVFGQSRLEMTRTWGLQGEHTDTLRILPASWSYTAHDYLARTGTWSRDLASSPELPRLDTLRMMLRSERAIDSVRLRDGAVRTCHGINSAYRFTVSTREELFSRCSITLRDSVDLLVERLLTADLGIP